MSKCKCSGYHWHEGRGHVHEPPEHAAGHHGPPFGKKRVVEVPDAIEEPDYTLVLKASIDRIKEQRDATD